MENIHTESQIRKTNPSAARLYGKYGTVTAGFILLNWNDKKTTNKTMYSSENKYTVIHRRLKYHDDYKPGITKHGKEFIETFGDGFLGMAAWLKGDDYANNPEYSGGAVIIDLNTSSYISPEGWFNSMTQVNHNHPRLLSHYGPFVGRAVYLAWNTVPYAASPQSTLALGFKCQPALLLIEMAMYCQDKVRFEGVEYDRPTFIRALAKSALYDDFPAATKGIIMLLLKYHYASPLDKNNIELPGQNYAMMIGLALAALRVTRAYDVDVPGVDACIEQLTVPANFYLEYVRTKKETGTHETAIINELLPVLEILTLLDSDKPYDYQKTQKDPIIQFVTDRAYCLPVVVRITNRYTDGLIALQAPQTGFYTGDPDYTNDCMRPVALGHKYKGKQLPPDQAMALRICAINGFTIPLSINEDLAPIADYLQTLLDAEYSYIRLTTQLEFYTPGKKPTLKVMERTRWWYLLFVLASRCPEGMIYKDSEFIILDHDTLTEYIERTTTVKPRWTVHQINGKTIDEFIRSLDMPGRELTYLAPGTIRSIIEEHHEGTVINADQIVEVASRVDVLVVIEPVHLLSEQVDAIKELYKTIMIVTQTSVGLEPWISKHNIEDYDFDGKKIILKTPGDFKKCGDCRKFVFCQKQFNTTVMALLAGTQKEAVFIDPSYPTIIDYIFMEKNVGTVFMIHVGDQKLYRVIRGIIIHMHRLNNLSMDDYQIVYLEL